MSSSISPASSPGRTTSSDSLSSISSNKDSSARRSSQAGSMNGVAVSPTNSKKEGNNSPTSVVQYSLPVAREVRNLPSAVGVPVTNGNAIAAHMIAAENGTLEAEVVGVVSTSRASRSSARQANQENSCLSSIQSTVETLLTNTPIAEIAVATGIVGAAIEVGGFSSTASVGSAAAAVGPVNAPAALTNTAASLTAGLKNLFFGKTATAAATAAASAVTPPVGLLLGSALAVGYMAGNSAMNAAEKNALQTDVSNCIEMSGKMAKAEAELTTALGGLSGADVTAIQESMKKIQNSFSRRLLGAEAAEGFDQERIKTEMTIAANQLGNSKVSDAVKNFLAVHEEAMGKTFVNKASVSV